MMSLIDCGGEILSFSDFVMRNFNVGCVMMIFEYITMIIGNFFIVLRKIGHLCSLSFSVFLYRRKTSSFAHIAVLF